MSRLGVIVLLLLAGGPVLAQAPTAMEQQRRLDEWWARQQAREAAERRVNGPRERLMESRMPQVRRWEEQRDRRNGFRSWPF